MTEPKTVDEIMALLDDFGARQRIAYNIQPSHDNKVIQAARLAAKQAITALAAERDQAVKVIQDMNGREYSPTHCSCQFNHQTSTMTKECLPHRNVRLERDALKARVRELQKELDEIPGRF